MTFAKTLLRPATAIMLAASIALTPVSATTAQAGEEELFVGAILGALTLGALAAATSPNTSSQFSVQTGRPRYHTPYSPPRATPHRPHTHQPPRVTHQPRPPVYGTPRGAIPAYCAVNVAGTRNATQYFGAACLERNFNGARALPSYCRTTLVKHGGRKRQLYSGSCLARAGFNVSGRR